MIPICEISGRCSSMRLSLVRPSVFSGPSGLRRLKPSGEGLSSPPIRDRFSWSLAISKESSVPFSSTRLGRRTSPHRAEVTKLLVHRRGRRTGLGTELMRAIDDEARSAGFSLLTLDAKRGTAAEYLYRQLGWNTAGTIPGYALDTDGTPHDAVFLYKALNHGRSTA
jgi:GNAT superfamily N-acetyltransferase